MEQTHIFNSFNRVVFCALLSTLAMLTSLRAHEVQPSVMDLELQANTAQMFIEWSIEAPAAGLDLDGVTDTNATDNADDYDRLRALEPAALENAFRAIWPELQSKIIIRAGDAQITPELVGVTIPDVGDVELARISTIELSAALPPGDDPLVIGWTADLGPLIVRQRTIENGYQGYLASGDMTDPIPRSGGSAQTFTQALTSYIGVGFDHIVPKGLDHILFVLGLFFLAYQMGPLLWQITAFTLAHTVTLALGALDIIRLSPDIVEPLIAASIVYVGIENVFARRLVPWRPVVVFCFGLLHGLGFASVLQDFGLGADNFVAKLIGFNVGVEVGQLAVIAATFFAFGLLFGKTAWYHHRIAIPVSLGIALIAFFWVLERTGMIEPDGVWAPFTALTGGGVPPFIAAGVALGFAALATAAALILSEVDILTDTTGVLTSAICFLCLTAAFTSGAWVISAIIVAAWILALRTQALGGPDEV
ncbi:MAG: HupE/UreJ family protein [Silicimonas sp.]|nr:HupE/UreJ family protein [Silicimonas sp.]